jgi:hypothetical protein
MSSKYLDRWEVLPVSQTNDNDGFLLSLFHEVILKCSQPVQITVSLQPEKE